MVFEPTLPTSAVNSTERIAVNNQPRLTLLKTTSFSAEPMPDNSDPIESLALTEGGYKVKVRKGVRRIKILQLLLGKMLWEEKLHMDEYLVLFELFYDCRLFQDPSFQTKYSKELCSLENLLSEVTDLREFPAKIEWQVDKQIIQTMFGLIPTANSYYGMKGNRGLSNSFHLQLNRHLLPQRLKPKSFIGVGYRDKGTLRNVAKDGSPHWKEVNSVLSNRERLEEERRELAIATRGHPCVSQTAEGG